MNENSVFYLTAFGTSMKPLIRSGDKIKVKLIHNISEIKRGNIVLYLENEQLYIHRIWKIKNNKCIISDDGYVSLPYYLNLENIIGKVILPFFSEGFFGLMFSYFSRKFYSIRYNLSIIKNFGKHNL